MIVFLEQIDKISKEKGIQIIEHFKNNTHMESLQKIIIKY